MTKGQRQLLGFMVIAAGVLIAVVCVWPNNPEGDGGGGTVGQGGAGSGSGGRPGLTTRPVAGNGPPVATTVPVVKVGRDEARRLYDRGMQAYGRQMALIEARTLLSKAYNSGQLAAAEADKAREALTRLASDTIFNGSTYVHRGDPYLEPYHVEAGDRLAPLVAKHNLRVPWQGIAQANGIDDPTRMQATQMIKLIHGPFHAVIRKGLFVMDVYLRDLFVRRIRVGIGAAKTPTPAGYFRVALGGKVPNAIYTSPVGSGERVVLPPGHPDYPLDAGGHWMRLDGIRERGTDIGAIDGYAIHGTNDPSSIGRALSRGCVRVSAEDIVWLFSYLYEKWSTVTILP